VVRLHARDRTRPASNVSTPARRDEHPVLRLQRLAGNRAVVRWLARTPSGIAVHKGSKLSAAEFAQKLKANKKVPGWLKKGLGSANGSLTESGRVKAPEDRIWLFVDTFEEAFKSGNWEITTAHSKIEVKQGKDGNRAWSQVVTPDLEGDERIGTRLKSGPGETTFMEDHLESDLEEVIYGWTVPGTSTTKREAKRGLIVIVTEIEVTAPDGRKQTFKVDPDQMAEAILHEISVHAGRIAKGLEDAHRDTDAAVRDVVEQVGGFFRPDDPHGGLQPGTLTRQIFAFVAGR
jgi:hypothetical protein